jgi:hypothetical protein
VADTGLAVARAPLGRLIRVAFEFAFTTTPCREHDEQAA